jgi:hypothetical protein
MASARNSASALDFVHNCLSIGLRLARPGDCARVIEVAEDWSAWCVIVFLVFEVAFVPGIR